jgi:hypothetical protein
MFSSRLVPLVAIEVGKMMVSNVIAAVGKATATGWSADSEAAEINYSSGLTLIMDSVVVTYLVHPTLLSFRP